MTVKYRHTRVFKSAQPPFLLVLVLGVITSLSSVVPASLSHLSFEVDDPSRIGQRGMYVALDEMCVAEEWLAELGFTLTASAVFVKLWRIKKLLVNPQLKKIQVNVKEGLAVVGFFVVFDLFVLTVMTIVDPPFYKFEFKYDAEGDIIEDYSTCETGTFGTVCTMTVEVLKIVFLIVGMVIVVQARNVPTEYNEGKYIAAIVINLAQVYVLGELVLLVAKDQEFLRFVVHIVATLFANATILFFMFIPKLGLLYTELKSHNRSSSESSTSRFGWHPSSPARKVGPADKASCAQKHADSNELSETDEMRAENAELRQELREVKAKLAEVQALRLGELMERGERDHQRAQGPNHQCVTTSDRLKRVIQQI